eukprot:TRINITY_DN7799_c0_g1_i2.p1 TRINITY_DN7799_c0_g1~~TRINITY_DN7799_c0_g1_i2.p1  ORF type:complete len:497 (+),score=96.49 TRINITY_DN7799_c0_g1_i2:110-1600(+)
MQRPKSSQFATSSPSVAHEHTPPPMSHRSAFRADRHVVLHVKVVQTRNLRIHISPDLPALYVMIAVDKQQVRTKEIKLKSPLNNPGWNYTVDFDVSRPDTFVIFTLCNLDDPEPVGQAAIPIQTIEVNKPPKELWTMLKTSRETDAGELLIHLHLESIQGHIGLESFDKLSVIGKGGFGKVMVVQKKDSKRIYAMKVLKKEELIEQQEVEHVMSEQQVMKRIRHSFIVGLKYSFQTPEKLFMVMDYINGGELFYHLRKECVFSEERARFYAAEIILALEYLHGLDLIYRDLKPENILIDMHGHICITDFGLVKGDMGHGKYTYTFCGTAEYLAPEILENCGYTKSVDWWSVGILLYEMLVGQTPFLCANHQEMYRRIVTGRLKMPESLAPYAQSLIIGLLEKEPSDRLGGGISDAEEIKSHPFFATIDWCRLVQRRVNPPFRPRVRSPKDISNFDPEFTKEPLADSPTQSRLNEDDQVMFRGFSYTGDSCLGMAGE